jgi:hypothetical protein
VELGVAVNRNNFQIYVVFNKLSDCTDCAVSRTINGINLMIGLLFTFTEFRNYPTLVLPSMIGFGGK